jgi:hypothetical protein
VHKQQLQALTFSQSEIEKLNKEFYSVLLSPLHEDLRRTIMKEKGKEHFSLECFTCQKEPLFLLFKIVKNEIKNNNCMIFFFTFLIPKNKLFRLIVSHIIYKTKQTRNKHRE